MDTYKLKLKSIVNYVPSEDNYIKLGERAVVFPIDHTSRLVSNNKFVLTSPVVGFDPINGGFETINTIYRPLRA